ncbi:MAG: hypothetical protein R3A49_14055 [Acidimicrobiia bacterium]
MQRARVGAVEFAEMARSVAGAARRAGLAAPVFRSPPRRAGCLRTFRRRGRVVSVRFRDRLVSDVLADMVEGVLVANDVPDTKREALRRRLLHEGSPPVADERRAVA